MEKEKLQHEKYNLLHSISMIVGIVIGSGIFFKTPQIINATKGNLSIGIFALLIGAFVIIFGSLTMINYSNKSDKVGGIIHYAEMAWGKKIGYIVGFFQVFFYYPAIVAVVSWAGANYICELFNLPNLLMRGQLSIHVWIITLLIIGFFYFFNSVKAVKAGNFQNIATIIKLIALISLGALGLSLGDFQFSISQNPITNNNDLYTGLFAAIVLAAFSYDGWLVAPSIAHEIKDSKKNLALTLTFSPLIIMFIYILYFIGMASFTSPNEILNGANELQNLATTIFGPFGMKIVLICIIISILGTVNGLILGYIRLPYALALRNEIVFSKQIKKINKKYDTPINSSLVCMIITLFWLLLHFLSIDGVQLYGINIFKGLAVDDLPIVLTYFFYVLLYAGVLFKKNINQGANIFYRLIYPLLATIGALFVIYGGLVKPMFNVYLIVSLLGIATGLLIKPKKND